MRNAVGKALGSSSRGGSAPGLPERQMDLWLPCDGVPNQLGVDMKPPPEPLMGTRGGGTVRGVAVGSTPALAGSGAPGVASTIDAGAVCVTGAKGIVAGGDMRGRTATSGMPSASA